MKSATLARVASCALAVALVATSLTVAPAAEAAVLERPTAAPSVSAGDSPVTDDVLRRAVAEARAADAISETRVNADGTRSVVIVGEGGVTLEVNEPVGSGRLSTGSDSYGGMFVGFNAFDQNLIISGAMTAIAAGMCALGPAVCVVASVAAVLASTAIGNGGGVQCGTKSLRVYPISQKKPRCA